MGTAPRDLENLELRLETLLPEELGDGARDAA
jgi:hypothetical protein